MKTATALFVLLAMAGALSAATRHERERRREARGAENRLGLSCARILAMSSTEWVAKFQKEKGANPQEATRAIGLYGTCYDQRTAHLGALLRRRHAAPWRSAAADFDGFEDALKDFTKTAIADAQPAPQATKIAYAHLYEKQFRYEFYREYEAKNLNPPLTPDEDLQFTKAKNRFGELIGLLPEAQAHQVHAAFGETIGTHQVSMAIKFALYRYAIFVLAPPSKKAFAPPPF